MNYKDPDFLKNHIKSIVEFYYPVCLDNEYGGYINQLRDDGSVFDRMTKHLVGTCRFVYNFSIASIILDNEDYSKAAAHGIRFLTEWHRQNNGGRRIGRVRQRGGMCCCDSVDNVEVQ